ncbi:MAG TPA: hypothetical protein VFB58_10500 [Chloroflexota bacterium]|nr:hypothetical protein [Chloroflexota bacterium]
MNRSWRMVPVTAILALTIFAVPMQASASTQYSLHVHGMVAEAYFGAWTSPTLYTEVYVNAGKAIGGNQTSYTFVIADQIDFSTNPNGNVVTLYVGQIPSTALQISSKLSSASLSGAIPVTDINNNPATLWVNLSWTANGSPVKNVSNNNFSAQGFHITSHLDGTSVNASAWGSISDGTIDFTSGSPAQYADLNKVTESETVTTH